MKVELLYFEGCPGYEALLRELRALLAGTGIAAEIELRRVEGVEAAQRERFLGSPTLRVDGSDVEPGAAEREDFGIKCRLYGGEDGLAAVPPRGWILDALGVAGAGGSQSMRTATAEEVALALSESMPGLDRGARRLVLTLVRLLAAGEPVAISAFAEATGLERRLLEDLADGVPGLERDESGRIVSFMGLSLTETPHRLELDDATLYAWCAWDALFLPRLIGHSARVRSACARSGETVALSVSPSGFGELSPPGAVVSMLVPEGGFGADVLESFCHHVHFFASRRAGEGWLAEREGEDAFLLTVGEAFRLGELWTRHLLGAEEKEGVEATPSQERLDG